jgi:hypothetical protein
MDILNMNADDVTAYVNAKWPDANKSPLAKLFDTAEVAGKVIDVSDDDISEALKKCAENTNCTMYVGISPSLAMGIRR